MCSQCSAIANSGEEHALATEVHHIKERFKCGLKLGQ